jgi:ribosomal protein S18 acetylase RimI-like enzyme
MTIVWTESLDTIDWDELSRLYKRAPLGNKSPRDLEVTFKNSRYKMFVRDSGKLVGAGRALADGVDCSYICDIAFLPEYQGMGLGKQMVEKLIELSKGHRKIILYAAPGKEGFYKKLGFFKMKTAMAIFADTDDAMTKGIIEI